MSPETTVPLGEQLVAAGRISRPQLEAALALVRKQGLRIGQALVSLGALDERALSEALRNQGKVACIRLTPDLVDVQEAHRLREKDARRLGVVVVNRIAGIHTLATSDPSDLGRVDEVSALLRGPVLPVHAGDKAIRHCLDHLYGEKAANNLEEIADTLDLQGVEVSLEQVVTEDDGGDGQLDKPVVNMVRGLLQDAYETRASDIHLEPRRNAFVARFRVDGRLVDRLTLGRAWARPCVARLKVLAQLDLAQNRLPQDGRAQVEVNGRPLDLRIATTPTVHGEGAVIRLLDGGREIRGFADLGLDETQATALRRMVETCEGMVLATGPTGSGKTTTLYALLQELNRPDRKIITLEDPVENQIEGVSQIHVHPKIGLTFARGLRSILRQDPDVVLVGEIRDEETARIGVQAALTGHLVLSTLHTVGTAETISRLLDMGVESYLLADTLRGVLAQRLIRRICPDCRAPAPPDPSIAARLGVLLDGVRLYAGAGCNACQQTGYRGRVAIREVLQLTPELRSLIRARRASDEIRAAAMAEGMRTLQHDAFEKVRAGVTTLAELLATTPRG